MTEWLNELLTNSKTEGLKPLTDWTTEWVMSEWLAEGRNEWINEWTNEWTNEWIIEKHWKTMNGLRGRSIKWREKNLPRVFRIQTLLRPVCCLYLTLTAGNETMRVIVPSPTWIGLVQGQLTRSGCLGPCGAANNPYNESVLFWTQAVGDFSGGCCFKRSFISNLELSGCKKMRGQSEVAAFCPLSISDNFR